MRTTMGEGVIALGKSKDKPAKEKPKPVKGK